MPAVLRDHHQDGSPVIIQVNMTLFGDIVCVYMSTYHDQKQIFFIMKTPPKLDYEWIRSLRRHATQYGLFCKCVLKFLVRKNMSLGDCLEGIQVRAAFVAYKEHFSRTPFSEHAHHLKV